MRREQLSRDHEVEQEEDGVLFLLSFTWNSTTNARWKRPTTYVTERDLIEMIAGEAYIHADGNEYRLVEYPEAQFSVSENNGVLEEGRKYYIVRRGFKRE